MTQNYEGFRFNQQRDREEENGNQNNLPKKLKKQLISEFLNYTNLDRFQNFKWKPTLLISDFINYLEEKKKKELIEYLEEVLWWPITLDDIINIWVELGAFTKVDILKKIIFSDGENLNKILFKYFYSKFINSLSRIKAKDRFLNYYWQQFISQENVNETNLNLRIFIKLLEKFLHYLKQRGFTKEEIWFFKKSLFSINLKVWDFLNFLEKELNLDKTLINQIKSTSILSEELNKKIKDLRLGELFKWVFEVGFKDFLKETKEIYNRVKNKELKWIFDISLEDIFDVGNLSKSLSREHLSDEQKSYIDGKLNDLPDEISQDLREQIEFDLILLTKLKEKVSSDQKLIIDILEKIVLSLYDSASLNSEEKKKLLELFVKQGVNRFIDKEFSFLSFEDRENLAKFFLNFYKFDWDSKVKIWNEVIFERDFVNLGFQIEDKWILSLKPNLWVNIYGDDLIDSFVDFYEKNVWRIFTISLNWKKLVIPGSSKVKINLKDWSQLIGQFESFNNEIVELKIWNEIKSINIDQINDIVVEKKQLFLLWNEIEDFNKFLVYYYLWKKHWNINRKMEEVVTNIVDEWKKLIEEEEEKKQKEIDLQNIEKFWNSLEWETNAEFEKWNNLYILLPDMKSWLVRPLPQSYFIRLSIDKIDKNNQKICFSFHNTYGIINFNIRKNFCRSFEDFNSLLKKLQSYSYNEIFKAKSYNNFEDFWNKIKLVKFKSNWNNFAKKLEPWQNLKLKSWKLVKDVQWNEEEVRYIWLSFYEETKDWDLKEKWIFYKIKFDKDKVILKWGKDSVIFDYNGFYAFILNSWVKPLTESEYKILSTPMVKSANIKKKGGWLSILSLRTTFKRLPEMIRRHMEQREKFENARLMQRLSKIIPEIWLLSDVKAELVADWDANVNSTIQNYKKRLMMEDQWWGVHAWRTARIIKKEIMDYIDKKGEIKNYRMKLKAAWYLLYAIEKWPDFYFRALRVYAGKWYWVKALLWKQHYEIFKSQYEKFKLKVIENSTDVQLQHKLAIFEMEYIWSNVGRNLFWSSFPSVLEGLVKNMVWGDLISKIEKDEVEKYSYDWQAAGMNSYFSNNRKPNWVGALVARAQFVQTYEEYERFYRDLIWSVISWFTWNLSQAQRSRLKKVARAYWYSDFLFSVHFDGHRHMLKLIDIIAKKLWYNDVFGDINIFVDWIWQIKIRDLINKYYSDDLLTLTVNWKKEVVYNVIFKNFIKWWNKDDRWKRILKVLNLKDTILFQILEDDDVPDDIKATVKELLLNKMNEITNESGDIDINLYAEWWYPYYTEGIIKIWRAIFKQVMFNIDDWEFKYKQAEWMWTNLKWFFEHYYQEQIYSFSILRFFLRKMKIWFFEYDLRKDKQMEIIRCWLGLQNWKCLKDVYIENYKEKDDHLPWIVQDTLEKIDEYMLFLFKSLKNKEWWENKIKEIIFEEIWLWV